LPCRELWVFSDGKLEAQCPKERSCLLRALQKSWRTYPSGNTGGRDEAWNDREAIVGTKRQKKTVHQDDEAIGSMSALTCNHI
jgi:hypothetical protein